MGVCVRDTTFARLLGFDTTFAKWALTHNPVIVIVKYSDNLRGNSFEALALTVTAAYPDIILQCGYASSGVRGGPVLASSVMTGIRE